MTNEKQKLVQELFDSRAITAPLLKRDKQICNLLKELCEVGERVLCPTVESLLKSANRKTVDRKSILEHFDVSRQLLTAHTSEKEVLSIMLTARQV